MRMHGEDHTSLHTAGGSDGKDHLGLHLDGVGARGREPIEQ